MRLPSLAGLLLFAAASSALAWARMPVADTVQGAKDHPLLSRFEGAKLVGYDVKEFNEAVLPAGKRYFDKERHPQFEKSLALEGKVTRIAYNYPRERSALEVMRNYEAALGKAGMKTVFACAGDSCGDKFGDYWIEQRLRNHFIRGARKRVGVVQLWPARDALPGGKRHASGRLGCACGHLCRRSSEEL